MRSPIARISPELDSRIKEVSTQQKLSYVEASRRIAESSNITEKAQKEELLKMLRLFK